jgi:excisionase family DNA binding protein
MTAPLLTADEVAELLNVSKWWVRQEARANHIPHVRLGRSVRFDAQVLEDWWS